MSTMYVCVSVYMYICSVSNKEEGEEVSVTKDKPPLAPSTPSEYITCSNGDVHGESITDLNATQGSSSDMLYCSAY